MLGAGLMDELDMNNCGDLFDHIDDLLNFPTEDTEGFALGGDCDGLKDVWPAPQDAFKRSALYSGGSGASELSSELYVPYDDIVQLEWLSNFVEDSFSAKSVMLDKDSTDNNSSSDNQNDAIKNSCQIQNPCKDSLSAKSVIVDTDSSSDNNSGNNHNDGINNANQFQIPSPVSVLESSSSTSEKTMVLSPETAVPGRARSKRARPVSFSARSVIPHISPTSSITSPSVSITSLEIPSEFENFAESHPATKAPKFSPAEQKKKKKKKLSPLPSGIESSASLRSVAVRKCMHCEITKTPQWRAGPMGPKTLCNACGVRYKSGRLFPEYRPAASPTFVPTIHSNSHKKVLEMRCKVGCDMAAAATAPELIPNRNHFLDYM